jgi:hypothetical protein
LTKTEEEETIIISRCARSTSTGILELSFLKAVDDLLMRLGMTNLLRSLRRQSPHRRALRGGLERFRALT